jgi:hypothetical protein
MAPWLRSRAWPSSSRMPWARGSPNTQAAAARVLAEAAETPSIFCTASSGEPDGDMRFSRASPVIPARVLALATAS